MFYRTGKYTFCGRVRASFSPKILRATAMKGLNQIKPTRHLTVKKKRWEGTKRTSEPTAQCHSTVLQNCVNAGQSVSQSLLKQRRYLLVQLTGTITVELSGVRTVTVSGSMVDTLALLAPVRRIIESSALDIQFDFQWRRYFFTPSDEAEMNIYHCIRRTGHLARFLVKQILFYSFQWSGNVYQTRCFCSGLWSTTVLVSLPGRTWSKVSNTKHTQHLVRYL